MNVARVIQWSLILLISVFCSPSFGQSRRIESTACGIVSPPARALFHVYLLMGQSNMVGRDTSALASQVDNPHILSLNGDGHWVVAREPMHAGGTGTGPGISFAVEMLNHNPTITIGLVPCAVGGTALRRWVKGGDLYEKAVARARAASESGVIKGVLWHQGESDTTQKTSAETYEVRLRQMFMDLRHDLGSPEMPIVVGQLGPFLTTEKYPYVATVRDAIAHVSHAVPRAGYADAAGLGDKGDKLHFSAEAEKELGKRFATAMQQIQTAKASPSSTTPTTDSVTTVVDVWTAGKMPGSSAKELEGELPSKGDGVQRIANISHPTLTLFPASKNNIPAPTMIVCPGGGYSYVTYNKEGTEIAAWLNSIGMNALVLKYRVPHNRDGALQDLQRALSLARTHAEEWHIDPKRLGVIGFSAGGNLAAKASTLFDQRAYSAIDAVDQQSCRPDFAVLVYPAYLDREGKVTPDLNLTVNIPPTLFIHSEDDRSFIAGSKLYHAALDKARMPNQFLLYPTGGHGYGLHCDRDARVWPQDAMAWLSKINMLKKS